MDFIRSDIEYKRISDLSSRYDFRKIVLYQKEISKISNLIFTLSESVYLLSKTIKKSNINYTISIKSACDDYFLVMIRYTNNKGMKSSKYVFDQLDSLSYLKQLIEDIHIEIISTIMFGNIKNK